MKIFLLAISTVFFFSTAQAMSFSVASENLLYFEHARLSSAYCEKQGIPTDQPYGLWQKKNRSLFTAALLAFDNELGKFDVSKDDQTVARDFFFNEISKKAQEHVSKKGVDCARFDSVLQMYSSLLKR